MQRTFSTNLRVFAGEILHGTHAGGRIPVAAPRHGNLPDASVPLNPLSIDPVSRVGPRLRADRFPEAGDACFGSRFGFQTRLFRREKTVDGKQKM